MKQAPLVLIVGKKPALKRLSPTELAGLLRSGVAKREVLLTAAENHARALATVCAAIKNLGLRQRVRNVDDLRPADSRGAQLAISVGGDGTVLVVQRFLGALPLAAVNSDPARSVGYFTRLGPDALGAAVDNFFSARTPALEKIHRLAVRVGSSTPELILNECLFTNRNPAAMSRYVLEANGVREAQWSSGVWVSTAAGSTGAIGSAGMEAVPAHEDWLLLLVREPFLARGQPTMLRLRQNPAIGVTLTCGAPNMALYLDGHINSRRLRPGTAVHIGPGASPLLLLR